MKKERLDDIGCVMRLNLQVVLKYILIKVLRHFAILTNKKLF